MRFRHLTQFFRHIWLRFIVDIRKYSPRLITEAPLSKHILYIACPALMEDRNVINCTVATLTHYKEKQSPHHDHEFLLAAVVIDCDGVPCTINMRIERLIRDQSHDLPNLNATLAQAALLDVVSISGLSGNDFVSRDACEIIETLTFSSLPLSHFSRFLLLLTNDGESCQLPEHQCSWFCWIIKKATTELWGGSATAGAARQSDGQSGTSPSKLESDSTSLRRLLELYRALPSGQDVWVDAGQVALVRARELQEALERERTARTALEARV